MAAKKEMRRRFRSDGARNYRVRPRAAAALFVVLGIIDFGFLFQRYETVTNAAREGARMAVLPDYTEDDVTGARDGVPHGRRPASGRRDSGRYIGRDRCPPAASTMHGARCVTVTYTYMFSRSGRHRGPLRRAASASPSRP